MKWLQVLSEEAGRGRAPACRPESLTARNFPPPPGVAPLHLCSASPPLPVAPWARCRVQGPAHAGGFGLRAAWCCSPGTGGWWSRAGCPRVHGSQPPGAVTSAPSCSKAFGCREWETLCAAPTCRGPPVLQPHQRLSVPPGPPAGCLLVPPGAAFSPGLSPRPPALRHSPGAGGGGGSGLPAQGAGVAAASLGNSSAFSFSLSVFLPLSLLPCPSPFPFLLPVSCSYESSAEILPHTPRLTHFPTVSGSPASLADSMQQKLSCPRRRRQQSPSAM